MSIRHLIGLSLALFLALLPAPERAHAAAAAAKPDAPATAATPSTADLEHLVGVLQDDQQRQRLIKDL
jgi:hypothetical protein